ncbi:Os04g0340550 [Oryza sativa Japonica Group]|uniref:Os04g0340550 protein n=1 Tax=Oryza sativa subsp. japonica TaxID=39947 RepID=A0A0P0W8Q7_ORYSJ|nr:Os04g0340550 [Oryza sativa Japonica Group]
MGFPMCLTQKTSIGIGFCRLNCDVLPSGKKIMWHHKIKWLQDNLPPPPPPNNSIHISIWIIEHNFFNKICK